MTTKGKEINRGANAAFFIKNFDGDLRDAVKAEAKKEGVTFKAYVEGLFRKDLGLTVEAKKKVYLVELSAEIATFEGRAVIEDRLKKATGSTKVEINIEEIK